MTLGDYLRPLGVRTVLVGKTHMRADIEGMERLGIDPNSIIGVRVADAASTPTSATTACTASPDGRATQLRRYNRCAETRATPATIPWHDWANAAQGDGNGSPPAGPCAHARQARARAGGGFRDALHDAARHGLHHGGGRRAALVPAPLLHQAALALYRARALQRHVRRDDVLPAVRSREGAPGTRIRSSPTSWTCATRATCARDEVREKVIPVYMGLIKQIDDQLGVLFRFMEERGLLDNTLIVFTSDHGDYLGDHWMGEKDLFHEPSVKIPLIVFDPSREADATRGTVCDALVEAIDLAPTFLEYFGGKVPDHILEGAR